MDTFDAMKTAVDDNGEVHAILEEHDKELEVRAGQLVDVDADHFAVATRSEKYVVAKDRIVSFYVPQEIWH